MAHSSDTPILQALVPAGDDLLMALDVSTNPPTASKLRLNQIGGLTSGEVTAVAAGTINVSTRAVLIISGTTSTVNIPAPSGVQREFHLMNGGSGSATVTSAAANVKSTASPAGATTSVVTTGTSARYLSDGSFWHRVQ